MLKENVITLEEAYQASELVCEDLSQGLDKEDINDNRHNIMSSLHNAELIRDFLLSKVETQNYEKLGAVQ